MKGPGKGVVFSSAAAGVALALVTVGWFTGLRAVMHEALLSVAVLALLPLLIIGGGLLVLLPLALVLGVFSYSDGLVDAAEGVVEGGGWLLPRYYPGASPPSSLLGCPRRVERSLKQQEAMLEVAPLTPPAGQLFASPGSASPPGRGG